MISINQSINYSFIDKQDNSPDTNANGLNLKSQHNYNITG